MHRALTLAAIGLFGASLAACVASPPPLLAYAGKDCQAQPSLFAAVSLTASDGALPFTVKRPFDATTPCLTRAAASTPYQLFALPAGGDAHVITAGARLGADRTFSPNIAVLDAKGTPIRTFAADDYFVRGDMLSVQFRPRPAEAYLLITIDPARIGKTEQSIVIGERASTAAAGPVFMTFRSGLDQQVSRIYSYDGVAEVQVTSAQKTAG